MSCRRVVASSLVLAGLLWPAFGWSLSFFNGRALGESVDETDARMRALGGPTAFSALNPAFYAFADQTLLSLTVSEEVVYGRQGARARLLNGFRPGSLYAGVPLGWGFHLGLTWAERFNQDFDVYSDTTTVGDLVYQRHLYGLGGIYDLGIALGKRFGKVLALGAQFDGLVGASTEEWTLLVTDQNYVTKDTTQTVYSGFSWRLGAVAQPAFFRVGAFLEGPARLDLTSSVTSAGRSSDTTSSILLPYAYGVGVAALLPESIEVVFDCRQQAYRETVVHDTTRADFSNGAKLSLGVQFRVAGVPVRVGVFQDRSYLVAHDGTNLHGLGLGLGSSLPIKGFGTIDLALEGLERSAGDLEESVLRASGTLHFEEPWKKRPRKWGW